jgi:hypothetical protein
MTPTGAFYRSVTQGPPPRISQLPIITLMRYKMFYYNTANDPKTYL